MHFIVGLLILISASAFSQSNSERLSKIKDISRFAFGSCNEQDDPQPLWKDITAMKPDLFIWGGDSIYADWEDTYDIKGSYEKQNKIPDYMAFKAKIPMLGMWDDHDYAWDNANGTVVEKKENQKYFLDFIEEASNSPRRKQEGIYASYEYGSPGKRVKFILLDNRYFKDLEEDSMMLGQKQWDWLENELKENKAQLTFILTGLSVLGPAIPISEEWADYPAEQSRMLNLVDKYSPKGVVFLSGDKHFSTIFQRFGYLEFLSSGMTHVAPSKTWWFLRLKFDLPYFDLSYGLIDIAWEGTNPVITLSKRSQYNETAQQRKFRWENNDWIEI